MAPLVGVVSVCAYIAPATLLNVPCTAPPVAVTAAMMTTAIPAAMRPYSMAVTPASSFKKRFKRFMGIPFQLSWRSVRRDRSLATLNVQAKSRACNADLSKW